MANNPPTGTVTITGTAAEDRVLTANSTLSDADVLGTLHYQWQHDVGGGFVNVGADQSTYTLGDGDIGGTVRVEVSYTDGEGFVESVTSAPTVAITASNDAPTGGVSITGITTEDQVLTADTSTLADSDGLGTLHYRWQRDTGSGYLNVGLDQATYTLGDADVGAIVRVVVSYTDGQNFNNSVTSASTAAISNINDAPTGGLTITGTATEDQVLTANTAALVDPDGFGTLHYRWQHDVGSGFVNVGADQSTYTLGDGDVGGTVRAIVNYTDGHGTAEAVTSAATAAIANVNDPLTGTVTITGAAAKDRVLTAVSTLSDGDGIGTLHYQWQHNVGGGFVNVGADQSTYTLGDADVGGAVRVIVSYSDAKGTAESVTTASTVAIAAGNDAPTGGVSITGTATEDQVLTADTATLADVDGLGTLHYQWQRNDGSGFVNVGLDQATYTMGDADVDGIVRVVVSYEDGQGLDESVTSAGTAAIANVNDAHTGGVTITGTAAEDKVLTANSTLSDVDGIGTLHYQWQRDVGSGFVNVGADQSTYVLGDGDIGGTVRVIVVYTDRGGTVESATSSATAAIAAGNDAPTGGVSVTGTITEDQVLTADTATLADSDGLGTLHYRWQRDTGSGYVDVGSDQATYTLGDADVGAIVRIVVSYTDGQNFNNSVTSASTAAISNINDAPTGGLTITGTATEDQVLTANTAALVDPDGFGTLHYQWQHDVGGGYVNVGLDQATYTLGDGDVGGTVRVIVLYTDRGGTVEAVTSAATAAIANVNHPHTGGATIAGTATEDQVLTASTATLSDADGLGTLHYQWQRNTGSGFVNVGADQSTYTLSDADVSGAVRVVVNYTDSEGTAESATSAATAAIAGVNDPHTGGVSISGTATENQVLMAFSTLSDVDGLGTLHYQWQHDVGSGFVNVGTDQATYTLGDGDVGGVVRAVVSYADGQNFFESATSSATAAIANVNDAPVNTLPASLNAVANANVAISGLAISDVDSISLTTTLHVEHGTLNVAAIGGAEVVGSGSSTVTLTGTVAEIDAVLGAANNVLYHSTFNFNGIDHLTMTSDDGSLSDTDVLNIQVAPAIAAYTINGITRPALNLDSTGHIILDQPAADFASAYGIKALYLGVPASTPYPPVAAQDFHLV